MTFHGTSPPMTQHKLGTIQKESQNPQPWLPHHWCVICQAIPLPTHYQPITWHPKIVQNASKPLSSQSYPFRTSLCPQSYKASSGKPLVEQHSSLPLPIRPGNWRSHCRKQDKPLVLPLLGWVSLYSVYLHPIPHPTLLCFTSTPLPNIYWSL